MVAPAATARHMATPAKTLRLLRHGQALHNVNAEAKRNAGCSFQEFLDQMKADDAFDAALTAEGREQARQLGRTIIAQQPRLHSSVELVVSSPLSRAVDTADLCFPAAALPAGTPRICHEAFREFAGQMVNGKRRTNRELHDRYASAGWDTVTHVPDGADALFEDLGEVLESNDAVAERGYQGLRWLWGRQETHIVIAAHGGFFAQLLNTHPKIVVAEELRARFSNCELRSCLLTLEGDCFHLHPCPPAEPAATKATGTSGMGSGMSDPGPQNGIMRSIRRMAVIAGLAGLIKPVRRILL